MMWFSKIKDNTVTKGTSKDAVVKFIACSRTLVSNISSTQHAISMTIALTVTRT